MSRKLRLWRALTHYREINHYVAALPGVTYDHTTGDHVQWNLPGGRTLTTLAGGEACAGTKAAIKRALVAAGLIVIGVSVLIGVISSHAL